MYSAFAFVIKQLRGTGGHLGAVQGVLGRIKSQHIVHCVRKTDADGTSVSAICFSDAVVLGLTAKAVGEEVRGLDQGDIHFDGGCAKASGERQDGKRTRAIEERDDVERTVQQATAPAELACFRSDVRRILTADEVAAKVEQR